MPASSSVSLRQSAVLSSCAGTSAAACQGCASQTKNCTSALGEMRRLSPSHRWRVRGILHSSSCLRGKHSLRALASCPRSSQANRIPSVSVLWCTVKPKKSKALVRFHVLAASVQSRFPPTLSVVSTKTPPPPLGHHRQTARRLNAGFLPFAHSTARAWNSGKSKPFLPLLAVALCESGATRPVSHRHLQGGALPWFYLPLSSRCSYCLPYRQRRLLPHNTAVNTDACRR
jgi:hypothetical protein